MASDLLLYGGFVVTFLILWGAIYVLLPLVRHGHSFLAPTLARMATRWPGANRYAPIALIVIVGAIFTAWAGDAFLDLAELVHAKSEILQATDINAHRWAVSHRTSGATGFMVLMSTIGGPAGVGGIAVIAMIALVIRKRYRWFVYLAITVGGGGLLNLELKHYFERARPDVAEMLRRAHGYSFPSGHAMGSTVVFGALSYLAFEPPFTGAGKPPRSRSAQRSSSPSHSPASISAPTGSRTSPPESRAAASGSRSTRSRTKRYGGCAACAA